MVAIISVILILVTTIGYIALFDSYADSRDEAKTVVPSKAPSVSATSYMVMSGSTSEKIAAKHADRKMQPGRITMLMAAMVAIDNMYNDAELKNTVETGPTIAEFGKTFKEGESATVGSLLDAMLVGGDIQAAELIAKYSASSREIFVNEMNSKCMELGLMDTFFTNASGRYDINQYSTASDLAVITQAAFRYQLIKDTLTKKNVTITAFMNKKPREITFESTDPLLTGNEKTAYQYVKGGILGLVDESVNAAQFAAAATKDDMEIIVVLMDSNKENAAAEAKALFEYGDAKATKNTIVKKGKMVGHARVRGGASTRVPAYTESKGFAYVPPEGTESLIQTQVSMYDDLEAPLKKGDKVGEFQIYVADELKGTVDLIIKDDVPVGWFPSKYYISNAGAVAGGVILFLLLAFLLRVRHVKHRREKRRAAMRRARIRELAMMQLEVDADRKRRDWSGTGYDTMPLRTTDIRREAMEESGRKGGKKRR